MLPGQEEQLFFSSWCITLLNKRGLGMCLAKFLPFPVLLHDTNNIKSAKNAELYYKVKRSSKGVCLCNSISKYQNASGIMLLFFLLIIRCAPPQFALAL